MLQIKLNLKIVKLGQQGMREWENECRQECRQDRIELQELKENLWRWREKGGGKIRTGKGRIKEPDDLSMRRKLKFLDETLEKEKRDWERCKNRREKDKSRLPAEAEKKRN